MSKGRLQLTVDMELYEACKKFPREVSISEIVNLLLKLAIEEVKMGREMNKKEFENWLNNDPERLRVKKYLQEKLGPSISVINEAMVKFKALKKKR